LEEEARKGIIGVWAVFGQKGGSQRGFKGRKKGLLLIIRLGKEFWGGRIWFQTGVFRFWKGFKDLGENFLGRLPQFFKRDNYLGEHWYS